MTKPHAWCHRMPCHVAMCLPCPYRRRQNRLRWAGRGRGALPFARRCAPAATPSRVFFALHRFVLDVGVLAAGGEVAEGVALWLATKLRWKLTADRAEIKALRAAAGGCNSARVAFRPAA